MEIRNFYDLEAWQKGRILAVRIYEVTRCFPREEVYGMTSQLRRAATSVSANIAEGFDRYHFKDKIRFYYQARGSAAEVQSFLFIATDLGFMNKDICADIGERTTEIRRLINGLIRSIENQQ